MAAVALRGGVAVPARDRVDVETSVRELYDVHYARLAGWTAKLVGDTDLAHDLATEAFLKLFREFGQVDEPRPWLYTVTANLVRDHWRKRGREAAAYRRHEAGRDDFTTDARPRHHPHRPGAVEALPDRLRVVVHAALLRRPAGGHGGPAAREVRGNHQAGPVRRAPADGDDAGRDPMNRHLSDLPGEGEQRDPVADFFAARARRASATCPRGTDRWESMVVEARRPRRRSWLPYLAGAAAVVVAAGGRLGHRRGPGTEQARRPGQQHACRSRRPYGDRPTEQPTVGSRRATGPRPPSTPTATRPLPVPNSFDIVSMTNAGGRHLFALGRATCPTGECTAVIGSDDDGAHLDHPGLLHRRSPAPGPRSHPGRAHQVVGIRFANPQVGYVFGSTRCAPSTAAAAGTGSTSTAAPCSRSRPTAGRSGWPRRRACPHTGHRSTPRGCADLQVRSGAVTDATTAPVTCRRDVPGRCENAWIAHGRRRRLLQRRTSTERRTAAARRPV